MRDYGQFKGKHQEVIGLIPAGGQAARIAPLPFSKELYPVGYWQIDKGSGLRPKMVCLYLLERMRLAGIDKAYIVLRKGKWDIPAYLGDGKILNMHFAYLMMRLPFGAPYTLDQAYPFVKNALVAFGFPDIIFRTEDVFVQLLGRQADTNADVVLGVFPVDTPQKWDMVDLCDDGRIKQILGKPSRSNLCYTWVNAVWTPAFTHFMHKYLSALQEEEKQDSNRDNVSKQQELSIGDVIQAAIGNNLRVESVKFPDPSCLDIGTPEDLAQAVRSENFSYDA